MTQDQMKQAAAQAALALIAEDSVVGVGTGSTVNYFIEALASIKHRIEATVASSIATAERLKALGMRVLDLNVVSQVHSYVDGADEVNPYGQLLKGGGGALTREKILACAAKEFICIVDAHKQVDILGEFPVALEVIPMARSLVARAVVKMGGHPYYREGFITDNGNIIIDVDFGKIVEPRALEQQLNQITGVVCHGIFAQRLADKVLVGTENGVKTLTFKHVSH